MDLEYSKTQEEIQITELSRKLSLGCMLNSRGCSQFKLDCVLSQKQLATEGLGPTSRKLEQLGSKERGYPFRAAQPVPDVLAPEVISDLESAVEQFALIAEAEEGSPVETALVITGVRLGTRIAG